MDLVLGHPQHGPQQPPAMIAFWAIPTHRSSTVAHAYQEDGSAICGSELEAGPDRWESRPNHIACRKCRLAILKLTGVPCSKCDTRGFNRVRYLRSGPASRVRCQDCDGLGYRPLPWIPDPPPKPIIRPWLP